MKYGHWDEDVEEYTDDEGYTEKITRLYCSECGNKENIRSDYCRRCGAKMTDSRTPEPGTPRRLGCDISFVFGKRQYKNEGEVYYDDVSRIFLTSGEYVVMYVVPRTNERIDVLLTPKQAQTIAKILLKLSGDKG